jgi:Sortase and related acyltransferases
MTATLRPAHDGDIPGITAIYAQAVSEGTATFEIDPPDDAEMRHRLHGVSAHDLPWLVVTEGAEVLGYAYLSPFRLRPAYRYSVELSIYIDPAHQGMGLGHRLMDALIVHARQRGLRHIIGAVGDSANAASLALHTAHGFHEAGRYRQVGYKFDRWIDVVLMQLDLNPAGTKPDGAGLAL